MSRLIPFNKKNLNITDSDLKRPLNMIDNFFNETLSNLPRLNSNLQLDSFKVDVSETENEYVVEAELPEIKREEISLDLDENRLSIIVERQEKVDEQNEERSYIHKERHHSSMKRSLYLENADSDSSKAEAKLENGLLQVTIPKVKKQLDHSKKIEIN